MKTFRTTFSLHYPYTKITLKTPILLVGSCFAENIGEQLLQYKFHALPNPFGTIFNPLSIAQLIRATLQEESPQESGFLEHEERWLHLDYHSSLSGTSQEELLQKIFHAHFQAKQFLADDGLLVLTLGTAWVYWHKPTHHYVANCHKQPAVHFEKKLLSIEEIVMAFTALHSLLPPDLKVLLTVSPVRHLKDTIPLNSVSKATLRLACHLLTEKYPERFAYFPAYELLLDDLRDYRFFAEDMLHPNLTAIQYIWEYFLQHCVDVPTQQFVERWEKIITSLTHRPFHPGSKHHRQFLEKLLEELSNIHEVNVEKEKDAVIRQLSFIQTAQNS